MILRPLFQPLPRGGQPDFIPAWSAIQTLQNDPRDAGWLITQPAHAALAGEIARHLRWPRREEQPRSEVQPSGEDQPRPEDHDASLPEHPAGEPWVRAISLHDSGWGPPDAAVIRKLQGGASRGGELAEGRTAAAPAHRNVKPAFFRPVSFINLPPTEALSAWMASIEIAEAYAPIAGYMVSRHFSRLAEVRISELASSGTKPGEESSRESKATGGPLSRERPWFDDFLEREQARRQRLLADAGKSSDELEVLVDQLQFCDVLSLYICSGAADNVVFPQQLRGETIRLVRHSMGCRLQPSPFATEKVFRISGLRYPRPGPQDEEATSATFEFAVA